MKDVCTGCVEYTNKGYPNQNKESGRKNIQKGCESRMSDLENAHVWPLLNLSLIHI